jgi:hypothetical protein
MQLFKIVGWIIGLFIIISLPLRYFLSQKSIPWSSFEKLKWKDFKGKVPKGFNHSAGSAFFYDYDEKLVDDSMEIEMDNYFMIYSSFVLHGSRSDYLLNHEQRHFDIEEIYVRKLREYISKWNGNTKSNYNLYLLAGMNKIYGDSTEFDYDMQTNHGLNRDEQSLWNNKIDSMLKKYEDFKKNTFKLYWPSSLFDFNGNSFNYFKITHNLKSRVIYLGKMN